MIIQHRLTCRIKQSIAIVLSIASIMLTGCGNAVACKDATVSGSDCVTLESQIIDGKYFPRYAYEFTDSRNYGVTQFSDEQIEFEAMNGIRIDT